MDNAKDILLNQIRRDAEAQARQLAGEFARSASKDKGAILDALEFEKWLAEGCRECLDR